MKKLNNFKVRHAIEKNRLTYYEVAEMLGISENTFFRRLRYELTENEQNEIVKIIESHSLFAETGGI